jgi:hypothetical protein
MSEYEFLGGLLGAPMPIAKAKATGLPMAANAELVLEDFRRRPSESRIPKVLSESGQATMRREPWIGR